MAEKVAAAKADKKEPELVVLKELPTQQIREFIGEDGRNYIVKTVEEVLAENNTMLNRLMKLLG